MKDQLDLLAQRAFDAYADANPLIRDQFGPGPHPKLEGEFLAHWRAVARAVLGEYQLGTKHLSAITPDQPKEVSMNPQDQKDQATMHEAAGLPPKLTPRRLTDHVTNPANDRLIIEVTDLPGAGGANHRYEISGFDLSDNPSSKDGDQINGVAVVFQNGPIPQHGVNGVTQEVLLAIVIDRLRAFQAGPFACAENAEALAHAEASLAALKKRTQARMNRGVEGTHTV
jgi:hypothetical protein